MKKNSTHIIFSLLAITLLAIPEASAKETVLYSQGKAKSRIVMADTTAATRRAAQVINHFMRMVAGDTLPVLTGKPKKGDIFIGEKSQRAGEDGFELTNRDDKLRIKTGGGKGAVYGAVTLVDDYMGVDYWADSAFTYNKLSEVVIPQINRTETPAFRYRQSFSYGWEDPYYVDWFRLRNPDEIFAGGLWVHTFNKLLPAAKYGKEHPEWYAMDEKGRRIPGAYSQWCLSNPEVFEAACVAIDSVFKANPGMKMLSISQNDRDESYCRCEECIKINEEEGSPSGALVRFLNRLAERYPDKEFSTLAYQYSMQPPRLVKPLPNVNIMLCDIGCVREKPLTETATGQEFVKALKGWSDISNNIFMWDYGINFSDVISPFPNFHILAPNLKLFRDNHVTMVHEQVNGHRGADMSEMRAWVLGKLMWNPDQNVDSLVEVFIDGYYGAAAPYIYQYHAMRQDELAKSGKRLWIYDTPISHKDGMLSQENMKKYSQLMDKALNSVKQDTTLTRRVQLARLPIIYSELEIARTDTALMQPDKIEPLLEEFERLTQQLNVKVMKENGFTPAQYGKIYRERYLPSGKENVAKGAKIKWINPPVERYMSKKDTEKALTDGKFGGFQYEDGWSGWVGNGPSLILDFGEPKAFSTVRADFLQQPVSWILLPKKGTVSVSNDGVKYVKFGEFTLPETCNNNIEFHWGTVKKKVGIRARYVKIDVESVGTLPEWHLGAGNPACLFMDEIEVF